MKELSIEQKAQRYDEALERYKAKQEYESQKVHEFMEYLFPELRESEDERIKNALIRFHKSTIDIDGIKGEDVIAWLEKQGEHTNFRNAIQIGDKVTRNRDGVLVNLSQLNRVAKKDDKVEPKFKVGDWVVSPNGVYYHIDAVQNGRYEVTTNAGNCCNWPLNTDIYHLWTIKDAEDGDVLVDEGNNIGICKEIESIYWDSYIYLGCDGILRGFSIGGKHEQTNTHPATKEQCDLLFAKMKEAGYEWNGENKELKKIEQKSTQWDLVDVRAASLIRDAINGMKLTDEARFIALNWLKSLKDRYIWKPSEEQLTQLKIATSKGTAAYFNNNILRELYKQLKGL